MGRILYWKLNNTLLKDFNDQVKGLVKEIFSENLFESHGANWEYAYLQITSYK